MKLLAINFILIIVSLAYNYLNLITITEKNNGLDINGNNYYMEGYTKEDKILIVENKYYEVIKEFKVN